jgi:maltose O-acetyltransferase
MYRNIFGMQIGIGSIVHWRLVSFAPERVRVGEHSILGNDGFLDGRSGITIGDNVNIAAHVHIYTLEHDPQSPDFATKGGPVDVGDRVFIGSRATILPNIKLGTGAVVAAGAVVTHDVDKFTIVAGVPAKKVGERTEDLAYMLSYHLPFQ